jgi:chemotaxis methyl-accepting protein methylase
LDVIIQAMAVSHGLDISRYEEAFLRAAVSRRMAASRPASLAAYGEHLEKSISEAAMLMHSLRIDHSEFFRNPLTFGVLERLVLPGLICEKWPCGDGEIRVWSAGCAGGQEAWSLAMLLEDLAGLQSSVEQASRLLVPQQTGNRDGRPTSGGQVPYRIFATDLSDPDVARAGVYAAEAARNVRLGHLKKYFSTQGDSFSIIPRLRERVDFSIHDLLDTSSASPAASIYGGFDLILCCNVLLYYQPDARQRILDKIRRALSPGGYFVTGEVERAIVSGHREFRAVLPPAAVFRMESVSP